MLKARRTSGSDHGYLIDQHFASQLWFPLGAIFNEYPHGAKVRASAGQAGATSGEVGSPKAPNL